MEEKPFQQYFSEGNQLLWSGHEPKLHASLGQ